MSEMLRIPPLPPLRRIHIKELRQELDSPFRTYIQGFHEGYYEHRQELRAQWNATKSVDKRIEELKSRLTTHLNIQPHPNHQLPPQKRRRPTHQIRWGSELRGGGGGSVGCVGVWSDVLRIKIVLVYPSAFRDGTVQFISFFSFLPAFAPFAFCSCWIAVAMGVACTSPNSGKR